MEIDKIAAALAAAQAQITSPPRNREVTVKTKVGNGYAFKYATLDAIIDHVRKPLTDNGIWFVQTLANGDGKYRLVTTLTHSSGQSITSETPLLLSGSGNQEFGSALTYMRRYALTAMLGIAADEDDDANQADGNNVEDMKDRRPVKRGSDKPAPTTPGIIPVGLTADDKPDWRGWGELFSAALSGCSDGVAVNALVEANAAALTNLAVANKKWADALQSRIDVKRGNLSQKPAA